jgi:hypothetical protein
MACAICGSSARNLGILIVQDAQHLDRGKLVQVFAGGVARFSQQRAEGAIVGIIHVIHHIGLVSGHATAPMCQHRDG